ncbi:Hypothetical protein NTJ_04335 [Nesidiocoris tenuis]|uniref:Uncharacterized protein n=1 Tax=Nesidiocoris tenuis TaxID=355587 RepID=A0ABN7AGY2_9HEMI|nr:Hypothetical protein NTJ_04335 [Nesidiocoris tenuis]
MNILPMKYVEKMFQKPMISKTNVKIRSYGGYFTKAKGEAYLNCEYKNKKKQIRFLIVDQSESPIFSADSCEKFDLIKRLYQVRIKKDEPEKSAPNEVNKATAKKLKKILRDLNDDTEKEKFITKNIDVFTGLGKVPVEIKIYSCTLHGYIYVPRTFRRSYSRKTLKNGT